MDSKEYDGIFTYTQTARDKFGKGAILASYPVGAYIGYVFWPAANKSPLWSPAGFGPVT